MWYKKFIKKYYTKKLLFLKHLRNALIISGCAPDLVDEVLLRNDAKESVNYFKKDVKKRKLRCFYEGENTQLDIDEEEDMTSDAE